MMVHGCRSSSRASAVSATGCSRGSTAVAVTSDFCLVGLVAGVGALESRHEGWFCGAGCASAAAEHVACYDDG